MVPPCSGCSWPKELQRCPTLDPIQLEAGQQSHGAHTGDDPHTIDNSQRAMRVKTGSGHFLSRNRGGEWGVVLCAHSVKELQFLSARQEEGGGKPMPLSSNANVQVSWPERLTNSAPLMQPHYPYCYFQLDLSKLV
eukprot:3062634-Amphidinium_carterae.1